MKWKNRVIHAGVLVLVFLAAVVIFGYVTNKKNSNMTTDMGAATRPQIAFSYNGYSLNDLPGYKNEMDLTGVRDSITPVSNGQLQVTIKAYENRQPGLYGLFDRWQRKAVGTKGEEARRECNAGSRKCRW